MVCCDIQIGSPASIKTPVERSWKESPVGSPGNDADHVQLVPVVRQNRFVSLAAPSKTSLASSIRMIKINSCTLARDYISVDQHS